MGFIEFNETVNAGGDDTNSSMLLDYSPYIVLFLSLLIPFAWKQRQKQNRKRANKVLLVSSVESNLPQIDEQIEGLKQAVEDFKDIEKDTYAIIFRQVNFAELESILLVETYGLIRNRSKYILADTRCYSNLKSSTSRITDLLKSIDAKKDLIQQMLNERRGMLTDSWQAATDYLYQTIIPIYAKNADNPFGAKLKILVDINAKWAKKIQADTDNPRWTRGMAYEYAEETLNAIKENNIYESDATPLLLLFKKFIQSHEEYLSSHSAFSSEFAYILKELEINRKVAVESIEYLKTNF